MLVIVLLRTIDRWSDFTFLRCISSTNTHTYSYIILFTVILYCMIPWTSSKQLSCYLSLVPPCIDIPSSYPVGVSSLFFHFSLLILCTLLFPSVAEASHSPILPMVPLYFLGICGHYHVVQETSKIDYWCGNWFFSQWLRVGLYFWRHHTLRIPYSDDPCSIWPESVFSLL